jgi:hypothetical protein
VLLTPRPPAETVAVLLDTTWRVAQNERDQTNSLDGKATSLATFASVVLSLTAGLRRGLLPDPGDPAELSLFAASIAALVVAIGLAVVVLLPKEHLTLGMPYLERFPTWSELFKHRTQVQGETIRGLVVALASERQRNVTKARNVRSGFIALFVGLLLVAAQSVLLLMTEVA